jgi:excisionase family DNA binding protein
VNSRAALLALAASLRTQADALEALAAESHDGDDLLTIEQGAKRCGLSAWTLRRWIRSGRLEASKIDERGTYAFRASALERAIEAEPVNGNGALRNRNVPNETTDALDELIANGELREGAHAH